MKQVEQKCLGVYVSSKERSKVCLTCPCRLWCPALKESEKSEKMEEK